MLLERTKGSTSEVKVLEPHFPVLAEFRKASYAKRYEILCRKLVRERLYDAACLILSDQVSGPQGGYQEPDPEIGFDRFAEGLIAKATAHLRIKSSRRKT
jgi:hypothetical protein